MGFWSFFFFFWSSNLAVNVFCRSFFQLQQAIHTSFKHFNECTCWHEWWLLQYCAVTERHTGKEMMIVSFPAMFFFWAQREALSVARPPDAPLPLIQLWISPECSLAAEWLNECMVKSPLVAAPHNFCSLNNRHWCCCLIRRHLFFHCSVVRLWSTVTCGHISKHAFAAMKALGING